MSVHGVRGNTELLGNGDLGSPIKDSLDDIRLAIRQSQGQGQGAPLPPGEKGRSLLSFSVRSGLRRVVLCHTVARTRPHKRSSHQTGDNGAQKTASTHCRNPRMRVLCPHQLGPAQTRRLRYGHDHPGATERIRSGHRGEMGALNTLSQSGCSALTARAAFRVKW